MASHVLYDAYVEVNSVDLSDQVKSVTLNYSARQEDDSAMSDATLINLAGILEWSVSVTFKQDYAASEVDATLFSLVGAAAFAIAIRPTSSAASATNPEFGGNVTLASYPPISGNWGAHHQTTAEFACAGTLSRSTS